MPALRSPAPEPLRIIHDNVLAGPGLRVVGSNFDLLFDQASGGLRRGVAFGQALLLDLPRVHLLPAADPLHPLPNPLSWRLQKLDVQPEGSNVRVRIQGTYEHLEGGYDLLITPEGALTVQAEFKYSGEAAGARSRVGGFDTQGLRLPPLAASGEWSVYPEDHIGRPGETRAFAAHSDQLPPCWPWASDNSPMGCNDFRSTKRHILWASLSYPHGPGIWVESDGIQNVRAEVQSDRIAFHINDWFGGTHVGWWEWISNYGEGKPSPPATRSSPPSSSVWHKRLGQNSPAMGCGCRAWDSLSMNPRNIQKPTSNIQRSSVVRASALGCSMLDVGCWMFSSVGSEMQRRTPVFREFTP